METAQIIEELPSLRTANEKHFRMGDGSYMVMVYPKPIHDQNEEGDWVDMNNTPVPGSYKNHQAYRIQIGSLVKSFAGSTKSPFLFAVEQDGKAFELAGKGSETGDVAGTSIAPNGRSQAANAISDNGELNGYTSELAYGDILETAELTFFNAGYDTVANIVVPKRQDKYEYSFEIAFTNLQAEKAPNGTICLFDDADKNVLLIEAPCLVDYAGAISNAARYSLDSAAGKTVLTVEADSEWMNAENRIYPVTLSCVFDCAPDAQSAGAEMTHLTQGSPSGSRGGEEELYLGYSCSYDVDESQVYLSFDRFPQLPEGAEILAAAIQMKQTSFSQVLCDSSRIGLFAVSETGGFRRGALDRLTWNTRPEATGEAISEVTCSEETTGSFLHWDVTEYAKTWNQNASPTLFSLKLENIESYSKIRAMMITLEGGKSMAAPLLLVRYSAPDASVAPPNAVTLSAGSAGELVITDNAGELALVCTDLIVRSSDGEFPFKRVYALERGEWRLSIQQTVAKYALGSSECLVYTDALGAERLFFPGDSPGEYVEQASGAVLIPSTENGSERYTLTDDSERTLRFINGRLVSITEQNGFTVYLAYNEEYSRASSDWLPHGTEAEDRVVQLLSSAGYGEPTNRLLTLQYGDSGELTGLLCGSEELRYEYLNMDGKLLLRGVHSTFGPPAAYQYDTEGRLKRAVDGSGEFGIGVTYTEAKTVSRVFAYTVEDGSERPKPEEIFRFDARRQLDVDGKTAAEWLNDLFRDLPGGGEGGER